MGSTTTHPHQSSHRLAHSRVHSAIRSSSLLTCYRPDARTKPETSKSDDVQGPETSQVLAGRGTSNGVERDQGAASDGGVLRRRREGGEAGDGQLFSLLLEEQAVWASDESVVL